jgi:hypothetical protein
MAGMGETRQARLVLYSTKGTIVGSENREESYRHPSSAQGAERGFLCPNDAAAP